MKRLLPLVVLVCSCGCFSARTQRANYAAALGGPTHLANEPAQWAALDSSAAALALQAGAAEVQPAVHLSNRGFAVEHRFPVAGGRCYQAGLGWAFELEAAASVYFQARADGKPVNDQVGGANVRLRPRAGLIEFCAERDGEALLTVSAIGAQGAIANNELLEYAFVLGSKREDPAQAAARRKVEGAAADDARARIETNIAIAKAREERNLAERCQRCREDFRLCQVNAAAARKNPRPGVTFSTSCEQQFRVCATGRYSGTEAEMNQCGPAPQ